LILKGNCGAKGFKELKESELSKRDGDVWMQEPVDSGEEKARFALQHHPGLTECGPTMRRLSKRR
jgi:hypothetical protein